MQRQFQMSAAAAAATLAATVIAGSSSTAEAGTLPIRGSADNNTRYVEEFSDGFFRMDLREPAPNQHLQRFHAISNPSMTFGNPAYDGLPNDADFRLGTLTYDESTIVGGNGVGAITAMTFGVTDEPGGTGHVNYARWNGPATVNTFSGTVTVTDGVPSAVNLTSTFTLNIVAFGFPLALPGTFSITGSSFDGYAALASPPPSQNFIYDFQGTLTTVPEPASAAAILGAVTVSGLARRRRRSGGQL